MRTLRSWPWTLALAAVLFGFAFLGVVGLGLRTSVVEIIVSVVVIAAAMIGFLRVLATGVRPTPSGLIIRDLTRTTLVAWTDVRRVVCEPTDRRNVHAPVLRMAGQNRADITVTILGSYRRAVAQRRTDELEAARTNARTGGRTNTRTNAPAGPRTKPRDDTRRRTR